MVGSRGLAEHGDLLGVAAERPDVRADPLDACLDVHEAEVGGRDAVGAVVAAAEESVRAQSEIDRRDDDVVLRHHLRRLESGQVTAAGDVGAAVDPHHDRQLRVRGGAVGDGDGQVLAVLVVVSGLRMRRDLLARRRRPLRARRAGLIGDDDAAIGQRGQRLRDLVAVGVGVGDADRAENMLVAGLGGGGAEALDHAGRGVPARGPGGRGRVRPPIIVERLLGAGLLVRVNCAHAAMLPRLPGNRSGFGPAEPYAATVAGRYGSAHVRIRSAARCGAPFFTRRWSALSRLIRDFG